MAPLYPRQNHSLTPYPPRPPKGPSTPPIPVTTSIDPKVFGELFAGTVAIFVLSVLFWKIGKFIRSFSRHRVLRKGNLTTTRYARTWYGWVTLETHRRNKAFFRNFFTWLRKWTAWKTTRADYRWVWWDPEQQLLKARCRDKRLWKWLPECFKDYDCPSADAIWNPKPLAECHGALLDGSESDHLSLPESPQSCETFINPLSPTCSNHDQRNWERVLSVSEETCKPDPLAGDLHGADDRSEDTHWSDARTAMRSSTMSHENQPMSHERERLASIQEAFWGPISNLDGSNSLKTHSNIERPRPAYFPVVKDRPRFPAVDIHIPSSRPTQSRRYRVWSARVQVEKKQLAPINLRDSSGPPGTPATDMLGSLLSEQGGAETLPTGKGKGVQRSNIMPARVSRQFHMRLTDGQMENLDWAKVRNCTVPSRFRSGTRRATPLPNTWHTSRTERHKWAKDLVFASQSSRENIRLSRLSVPNPSSHSLESPRTGPLAGLSDWEVRLIDQLNRKLVWTFNEFTPGQKPYHFSRLANHWLNRETWLVLDPVSRVSTDARREWGDPRFNVPYPERDFSPRPKHPVVFRKRADTPRIDSWRAAVNRQRRVSGIRDAIRTVELYDDSVEETPDGKIDPASWILPKPPQGFGMSTKQKEAWYEGGYGWQEKLDDWQRVRRGYRVHQALHEGRVNRNRAKEVATQIHRGCRTVSARLVPGGLNSVQPPSPCAV